MTANVFFFLSLPLKSCESLSREDAVFFEWISQAQRVYVAEANKVLINFRRKCQSNRGREKPKSRKD